MKILLLCNKSPWPLQEGGPIAMHAMITGLIAAGHQVKVLAVNSNKYQVDPASIPVDFASATQIELVEMDLSIRPAEAMYHYLAGQSYHVARFQTKSFKEKLTSILQQDTFDIIQVEMLYLTAYIGIIRQNSKARIILRAHNVEHLIWQRMAANCHNPVKKHYLSHLARTLRRFEVDILKKIDGLVAITEKDASYFRKQDSRLPILAIPFGIDLSTYPEITAAPANPDLFHIGSMNWPPNEEGIRWFLNNVWSNVRTKNPSVTISLAGRAMAPWLSGLKIPGVLIMGEVPDSWQFMQQHSVMVVPLFSGSGIRIKIIEAMAAGRAVISTGIGAEGIQYENGRDILIADTIKDFAEAITRVMSDSALRESLSRNARSLVQEHHDNPSLMTKLSEFYSRL